MHATAWTADDPGGGRWSDQLLSSLSASIGGGTNEIVRNVIAERVLGLPRDEEGDLMPGDLTVVDRRRPDEVGTATDRRRRATDIRRLGSPEPGAGAQWSARRRDRPVRRGTARRHDLRRPRRGRGQGRAAGGRPAAGRPGPLRRLEPGQGVGRARPAFPGGAERAARPRRSTADLLVENLRPGALERLGLAPARCCGRAPAAGHVLHHRLGLRRAGPGRAGMGAAGAGPGRHAAGTLHRRRPDLAPLPRGQRGGGAVGRPGRRAPR